MFRDQFCTHASWGMDKNGSLFAQKWMKTIKAIIGRLLVLPFVKKKSRVLFLPRVRCVLCNFLFKLLLVEACSHKVHQMSLVVVGLWSLCRVSFVVALGSRAAVKFHISSTHMHIFVGNHKNLHSYNGCGFWAIRWNLVRFLHADVHVEGWQSLTTLTPTSCNNNHASSFARLDITGLYAIWLHFRSSCPREYCVCYGDSSVDNVGVIFTLRCWRLYVLLLLLL